MSTNYFPTQISKEFGISFRLIIPISEKRKMKNEYKTKKATFQKDTTKIDT
jgi:hypothetical protein